jgi:futalosine hydrolase
MQVNQALASYGRVRVAILPRMLDPARVLVVAATARELAAPLGWRTLVCGVGPVEAAHATATEIARTQPVLILHVGIAGARRRRALAPGSLVIGNDSTYEDLGVSPQWSPGRVAPSPALVLAAQRAFPSAAVLAIGTSARVGGTEGCDVEAMEGFAVLRAAQVAGVPAIEVRAISNDIEEPDRARWHFAEAFAAITGATPSLVSALAATL